MVSLVTQSNFDQVEDRVSCRLIGKVLAIVFCFLVEFNRQLENVVFQSGIPTIQFSNFDDI